MLPLSAPDIIGLVIELDSEWGVNDGASGRNLGPELEKLNSLWRGEKTEAAGLILEEVAVVGKLNWLELAEPIPALKTAGCGWKLFAFAVRLLCPAAGAIIVVRDKTTRINRIACFDIVFSRSPS